MSSPLSLAGTLLLLAPISCVTVFAKDFGQAGDHWGIWVEVVRTGWWGYATGRDSPDCRWKGSYQDGVYVGPKQTCDPETYKPATGRRFVYVVMKIRNLGTGPSAFDLSAVRLGGGGVETIPSVLDRNWPMMNVQADPNPELDPGEEITRMLIFAFPKGLDPDRLSANGLALAFPGPVQDD